MHLLALEHAPSSAFNPCTNTCFDRPKVTAEMTAVRARKLSSMAMGISVHSLVLAACVSVVCQGTLFIDAHSLKHAHSSTSPATPIGASNPAVSKPQVATDELSKQVSSRLKPATASRERDGGREGEMSPRRDMPEPRWPVDITRSSLSSSFFPGRSPQT